MSSSQHPPDTPAFTALLDAYARWQNFEHDSARGTMSVRNVPGYDEQAHLSRRTPAPLAFLLACPLIDLSHLPEDERTCPICTDPYHRLSDRTSDQRVRVAQRLPCGHHLCNQCMFEWLTPFAESNNNSCPFDRRVLFPKFPPVLNTEGIQERLDLADWFATATGRQPVGAERNLTRALKVALVERRLGEAIDELEVDRVKTSTLMDLLESKISAAEYDSETLSASRREIPQLARRLATVREIADIMKVHKEILTLQARLQHMTERLARG